MKIFVTRRLPGNFTEKLKEVYSEVTVLEKDRPLTPTELNQGMEGADVVLCQLTDKISASSLPESMKCVVTYSVGLDHLDVEGIQNKGLPIIYTPRVLTEATADVTWGLILMGARRLSQAERFTREGRFPGFGPDLFLGIPLENQTLGILGMGRIGKAVAKRAQGFGMEILYHGGRSDIGTQVELDELFSKSQVLSVHCPLNEKTRHLIDASALKKMKKDAVLVNTARGAVLDEGALIKHLETHPEFFAALDVYEKEPEIPQKLLDCPNAICVPHVGSANRPTRELMAQVCVEEAIAFAKGEPLRYALTKG